MPIGKQPALILLTCSLLGVARPAPGYTGKEEACKYYYHKGLRKNIYTMATSPPEYPGGIPAYTRFINKHLTYPIDAVTEELQLTAVACFIVTENGTLSCFGIAGKQKKDWTLFEENYLSVLQKMPRWTPGKCNDKIVSMEVTQPIVVCLERSE